MKPQIKPRSCVVCNAEFTPTVAHATKCSDECRAIWMRQYKAEWQAEVRGGRKAPPPVCLMCSAPFVRKTYTQKTCSLLCSKAMRRQNYLASAEAGQTTWQRRRAARLAPVAASTTPKTGLRCGMDPIDEAFANWQIRHESSEQHA